jgi:hypothetical protein
MCLHGSLAGCGVVWPPLWCGPWLLEKLRALPFHWLLFDYGGTAGGHSNIVLHLGDMGVGLRCGWYGPAAYCCSCCVDATIWLHPAECWQPGILRCAFVL